MENQSVMSRVSGDVPISMLNFAGTHDSATAFVSLEKISRCQELTVAEQLSLGIRLLDIRLFNFAGEFFLVHAQADCFADERKKKKLTFDGVLSDCAAFLGENPRETIIMSIKKDRGMIFQEQFFKSFYNRYIRGNEDKWFLENRIPTLDECRGKIVLMRRSRRLRSFESKNSCGLDFSVWKDQASKSKQNPLPVRLSSECSAMVQDRYRLAPETKWNDCAKPFLDTCEVSGSRICLHYLSCCGGSGVPERCALTVNACFEKYELRSSPCGWIFLDFPTKRLCEKIYEPNKQYFE